MAVIGLSYIRNIFLFIYLPIPFFCSTFAPLSAVHNFVDHNRVN